jgi:hypothetical protein
MLQSMSSTLCKISPFDTSTLDHTCIKVCENGTYVRVNTENREVECKLTVSYSWNGGHSSYPPNKHVVHAWIDTDTDTWAELDVKQGQYVLIRCYNTKGDTIPFPIKNYLIVELQVDSVLRHSILIHDKAIYTLIPNQVPKILDENKVPTSGICTTTSCTPSIPPDSSDVTDISDAFSDILSRQDFVVPAPLSDDSVVVDIDDSESQTLVPTSITGSRVLQNDHKSCLTSRHGSTKCVSFQLPSCDHDVQPVRESTSYSRIFFGVGIFAAGFLIGLLTSFRIRR